MLKMNERGLQLIKDFESFRARPYFCPAGKLTVGYGSTGPHVKAGMEITEREAEALLMRDLKPRAAALKSLIGNAPTTSDQFSAMLSLLYNIGAENFRHSTVLKRHKQGDIAGAAIAFTWWNKARNPRTGRLQTLQGLVRRRAAEARLYRGEM